MPAQIPRRPEIMSEDQLMKEVLDKFVNCHEQTYEEFLSTFTHLSKEDNVAKGGAHGMNLSENTLTAEKWNHKIESNGHHFRNRTIFLHDSSECSEEDQIVIDEGQKVGSSFQGDMTRAGKVKILGDEVQPFFLDEDFDYDNVTLTPKFTAGEIATIQELAKQKRVDTSTHVCELHD
uniref:intraflagellar transport-associated protein isoform 3 n=1 Tax=Rattus norvegicus TaxID=10116 RepID=UPI003101116C